MAKVVKLASGKSAEVGTKTRIGKYDYTVQSDGSVMRSDGKVTAKAVAQPAPKASTKAAQPATKAPAKAKMAAPVPKSRSMAEKKAPVPMAADARPKAKTTVKVAVTTKPQTGITVGGNAGKKVAKPVMDKFLGMDTGVPRKPQAKLTTPKQPYSPRGGSRYAASPTVKKK